MKQIFIMCCILMQSYCNGQRKEQPKETEDMTQEIESFDIAKFNENKTENIYNFTRENGNYVSQEYRDDYYYEEIIIKNTNNNIFKAYYLSGSIKEKGVFYKRVILGEYFKYNKEGEVIEKKNYDKHYTFTLEDVLHYLEENNIKETEKSPTDHKITINIWRTDSSNLSADDSIVWEISYGLVPHIHEGTDKTFMSFIKITLDGKTGEELKKEYKRARVDQEWLLIQQ